MRTASAAALAAVLALAAPARAADESLQSIVTPRGATEKFILIRPANPAASVILLAGGHGGLGLEGPDSMAWGKNNFVVRTRRAFAERGFMVAVLDAPSDKRKMNAVFRMSKAHAGDIAAVVRDLKARAPVPVWLVGTSMGTFSAASGAIKTPGVDGLVLTSTVTRAPAKWKIHRKWPDGVASMNLERIRVPVLILAHKDDGCEVSPPAGAAKLAARLTAAAVVRTVLLSGGDEPRSGPCEALSRHGYIGIEDKAVDTIAAFIKASGK